MYAISVFYYFSPEYEFSAAFEVCFRKNNTENFSRLRRDFALEKNNNEIFDVVDRVGFFRTLEYGKKNTVCNLCVLKDICDATIELCSIT